MIQERDHPNQWFLDICPSDWRDKDFFIEQVLFRGLIHFWEDEAGGEQMRMQLNIDPDEYCMTSEQHRDYVERHQNIYDALSEAYQYALRWVAIQDAPWTEDAEEVDNVEATKHLRRIIEYRGSMWT